MKRLLEATVILLTFCGFALAQNPPLTTINSSDLVSNAPAILNYNFNWLYLNKPTKFNGSGAPGSITYSLLGDLYLDTAARIEYICVSTVCSSTPTWVKITGVGTVTSFSAGNLSPLFTTSVATATSTPALSFAQVTQNANLIFAGPTTGSAANPTFRALVAADIPALTSGSSILYGNGSGGFANVTVGSGLSFSGGTLSTTGGSGLTVGSTVISGGTNGYCLYNNSGVLGNQVCGAGSTTFQVNGTNLSSSSTVNFENSAATNGLTLSFANPSVGNVQLGLSGTLNNAGITNPSTTVNGATCTLGSSCAPYGGANVYTGPHTIGSSDIGRLVVMNCSSACAVTFEASPAATDWWGVESIGSTTATISLNSLNFNGSSSVPVLNKYRDLRVASDGSNYFGDAPLAAGSNVTLTPSSNSLTIASTGGSSASAHYTTLFDCIYNGNVAYSGIDGTFATNHLASFAGSNVLGLCQFTSGSSIYIQSHILLPSTWDGTSPTVTLDVIIGSHATGTYTLTPSSFCVTSGTDVLSANYNAGSGVATSPPSSGADFYEQQVVLTFPTTGCSAGNTMFMKIDRASGDTSTGLPVYVRDGVAKVTY